MGIQWCSEELVHGNIYLPLSLSERNMPSYLFPGSISCVPAVTLECGLIRAGKGKSDLVAVMINGGNFQC